MKTINIDLLDILGRSYVIDNCTAYIRERNYKRTRDYYITDMLLILNNRLKSDKETNDIPRFCDLVEPADRQSEEKPKSAVEVKSQIKNKMKNMFSEKEN